MKALVLTGTEKLELKDLNKPEPAPDEVVVRIAYAGVCGTDRHLYAGLPGSASAEPPIVLGHENSGVVVAIGSDVTNVAAGDRVAIDPNIYCGQCRYCRSGRPELCDHLSAVGVTRDGGFEEYTTAPASVVYKVADNVKLESAAMLEPISCAVHGVNLIELKPSMETLVIGGGFMGQLFVQILQAYGIAHVDMADIIDAKLEKMKDFGVRRTFNTLREKIPSGHYDLVVEAAGLPVTQEAAVTAAAKGAQVLMFGVGKPDQTFNMNTYEVFQKQLTIQGSFINPHAFEDSIALLSGGKLDVAALISHRLAFDQVGDYLDGKITDVNKAVVKVGADE